MDLHALGETLLAQRKALGIPRAELARRIGVTPTYVWLIEGAKPRKSGDPSRPRQEVLLRWAATLGLDSAATQHLFEMAGYSGGVPADEGFSPRILSPMDAAGAEAPIDQVPLDVPGEAVPFGPLPLIPPRASTERLYSMDSASFQAPEDIKRDRLMGRVREVLLAAEGKDRWEDTASLFESFLEWLQFRLERED